MPWVEVLALLGVSHMVGDFVFQTEWQATNKSGALGRGHDPRPLLMHVLTYGIAFVPAGIWVVAEQGGRGVAGLGVALGTHLIQDDGRLINGFMRRFKHVEPAEHRGLTVAVDQSVHAVFLLAAALVAAA